MSTSPETKVKKSKKDKSGGESPSSGKKKKKSSKDEVNLDDLSASDQAQVPAEALSPDPAEKESLRQSSSAVAGKPNATEPGSPGSGKTKKKKRKKGEEPAEPVEEEDGAEKMKNLLTSSSDIKELEELPEEGEDKGKEGKGEEKGDRKKSKKSNAKGKEPDELPEDVGEKIRRKSKKSISKGKEPEEVSEEADDKSITSFKKSKKKKKKGDAETPELEGVQFEEKPEVAPSTSKREIENKEAVPLAKPRKTNTDDLRSQGPEPKSECCRKARENEERRRYENDRNQPYGYEQRRYDSSVCSGYQGRSGTRSPYGSSLPRRTDQPTYSAVRAPTSDRREFWRGNSTCPDKPDEEIVRRICMSAYGQDRSRAPFYRSDDTYRHQQSNCLRQRQYGPEVTARQSSQQNPRTEVVQRWGNDDPGWNQQNMYRSPEQSARGQRPSYRPPEQLARNQSPTCWSLEELDRNQPHLYRPSQRQDVYQRCGPSMSGAPTYRPMTQSAITPFNTDSGVGLSPLQSCPGQRAGNCDEVYRNALPNRIVVNIAGGNDYRDPLNFYKWKNQRPATSQNVESQLNYNPQSEGQTRSQISKSLCSYKQRAFLNNSALLPSPPAPVMYSNEVERNLMSHSLTQLSKLNVGDFAPSSYSFFDEPERNVNTGLFISESESCVLAKPKKFDFKPSDIRRDRPLLHTFSQISPPFPKMSWYSVTKSEPSSRTSDIFNHIYSDSELWLASLSQSLSRDISVDTSLRNVSSRNLSLPHSRYESAINSIATITTQKKNHKENVIQLAFKNDLETMNEEVELNTGSRAYVVEKKIRHGPSSTKRILEESITNQMKKSSSGSEDRRKGSEWVIQYGVTNASVKDILEDEYSIDHKRWLTETYPKENSQVFTFELDFSDSSGENSTESGPSKVSTPPPAPKEKLPQKKKVVEIKEPEKEESSLEEISEEEPRVEQQPIEKPPEPKPPEEKPKTDCTEYCKKFLQERDPAWMEHEINRPLRRSKRHAHFCENSHSNFNTTSNSYILNDHKFYDCLSSHGRCLLPENSQVCSTFSHAKHDPPWDQQKSWKYPHSDNFVDNQNGRQQEVYANFDSRSSDQNDESVRNKTNQFQDVPRQREGSLFTRQRKSLYIIRSSPRCYKVMEEKLRADRDTFWRPINYKSQDEAQESPQSSYMSREENLESQQLSSRSQEEPDWSQQPTYMLQEKPVYWSHETPVRSQPPSYTSPDHQKYRPLYGLTPQSAEGRSPFWYRPHLESAPAQPCDESCYHCVDCLCSYRFYDRGLE